MSQQFESASEHTLFFMKHNLWNLLASLKNGAIAKKLVITHVHTKISENLLTLLWEEGYIAGYSTDNVNKINVFLKYDKNQAASISSIQSISKPGKRIYCSHKNLWHLNSQNKLIVISTNKGLKTLNQCLKEKIGGEVLLMLT